MKKIFLKLSIGLIIIIITSFDLKTEVLTEYGTGWYCFSGCEVTGVPYLDIVLVDKDEEGNWATATAFCEGPGFCIRANAQGYLETPDEVTVLPDLRPKPLPPPAPNEKRMKKD